MHKLPPYLEQAIDLHVHSSPDVDPRRFDDIDLARHAAEARMAALLIKSHQSSTVERAWLVSKVVPEIRVYGGLVLNHTVGGFNPHAVRLALRLGAREIWMPTRSARNHLRHHGADAAELASGLTVTDQNGRLLPVVEEILRLIAQAGCILGTGHLASEEATVLIRRARELGVKAILVTHPEWSATYYPVDLQRELAGPDLFFERCFVSTTGICGFTPFEVIEEAIATVGVASTVLASDLGQPVNPAPVEGLAQYAARLRSVGFSPDDIRRMMVDNPARLLG